MEVANINTTNKEIIFAKFIIDKHFHKNYQEYTHFFIRFNLQKRHLEAKT